MVGTAFKRAQGIGVVDHLKAVYGMIGMVKKAPSFMATSRYFTCIMTILGYIEIVSQLLLSEITLSSGKSGWSSDASPLFITSAR